MTSFKKETVSERIKWVTSREKVDRFFFIDKKELKQNREQTSGPTKKFHNFLKFKCIIKNQRAYCHWMILSKPRTSSNFERCENMPRWFSINQYHHIIYRDNKRCKTELGLHAINYTKRTTSSNNQLRQDLNGKKPRESRDKQKEEAWPMTQLRYRGTAEQPQFPRRLEDRIKKVFGRRPTINPALALFPLDSSQEIAMRDGSSIVRKKSG